MDMKEENGGLSHTATKISFILAMLGALSLAFFWADYMFETFQSGLLLLILLTSSPIFSGLSLFFAARSEDMLHGLKLLAWLIASFSLIISLTTIISLYFSVGTC